MLGTSPKPEGITNPPIDDLLEKVDSKYGLVVEAAKRARQINSYMFSDISLDSPVTLGEAEGEDGSNAATSLDDIQF